MTLNEQKPLSFTGNVWFVRPKGDDSKDGKTPKTAFRTLKAAFAASEPGDAVEALAKDGHKAYIA